MSFFGNLKKRFSGSSPSESASSAASSAASSSSTTTTPVSLSSTSTSPSAPGGPTENNKSSISSSSSSSSSSSQSASTATASSSISPVNKDLSEGGELDLVFLVDCTGSMSSYIKSAQQSIHTIVEKIVSAEKVDVQFALVGYRDWTDDWTTKIYPFTSSLKTMKKNIDELGASGGGDAPEAITAGLHEILNLSNYRKNSTKICVLIGDAPDHGLGENGDSYPQGDPQGRDPIVIARSMSDRGIVLYAVGCEPALSSSMYGRDFFILLGKITNGQYLPLSSAHLLPHAIISGAQEELSLDRLTDTMEKEMIKVKQDASESGVTLAEDEVIKRVFNNLKEKGVKTNHTKVDALWDHSAYNETNVSAMEKAPSLAAARKVLKPGLNNHIVVDSKRAAVQQVQQESAPVSFEQVHRAYSKACHSKWK